MAGDTEQLVVQLEARIRDFEKNFAKASRTANSEWTKIERRGNQAAKRLETSMAGAANRIGASFKGLAAGFGLGLGGIEISRAVAAAASQYVDLQNTLKVTGLEGKALEQTFNGLYAIAQKNGTAIAPLTTLYSRAAQAQNELKASSADLMRFTDGVSLALRVAGTNSTQASGALLQLSQALGSGKVSAEEFNSVNEGARPILQAVAAGMKEAGGSVSQLKALVNEGKVSSEAFFRAFLAGMPLLQDQAAKTQGTVGQAIERISNAFTVLIGELDKTTGASQAAAQNLSGVASVLEGLPGYLNAAAQGFANLQTWMTRAGNHPFWKKLGAAMGADFSPEGLRKAGLEPVNPVDQAFAISENAPAGSMQGYKPPAAKPAAPAVNPISLANFAVPGVKSGGSSGGRSEAEQRRDEVESYIGQLERSQRILQAEFDTLGKSNAERAKAVELARIGTVTDEGQLAKISALVDANEELRASIERVEQAQESAKDAASFFAQELGNGLIDAIVEGEKLQNVMQNLVKDLAKAALQAALFGGGPLGGLFGMGGKNGAPGGLLGMMFGSVLGFASGGQVRGPGTGTSDSIPARLSNGEYVVNAEATKKHLALLQAINGGNVPAFAAGGLVGAPAPISAPALASGPMGGPQVSQTVHVEVNANGGKPEDNQDLANRIGAQVKDQLRHMMGQELRAQLRPGGMLNHMRT